jgi:hypothetical protein
MRTVGREAAERAAVSIGEMGKVEDAVADDEVLEDEELLVVDVRCARHGTTPSPLELEDVVFPPTPYFAASSDEMVVVSPTFEVYPPPGAWQSWHTVGSRRVLYAADRQCSIGRLD